MTMSFLVVLRFQEHYFTKDLKKNRKFSLDSYFYGLGFAGV